MFTLLFCILFVLIFGKLFLLALRATWSIFKIAIWIIFLPLTLIGMVLAGLVYIAVPILAIVGLVSLLEN